MKTLFFLLLTTFLNAAQFVVVIPTSQKATTYKKAITSLTNQSNQNFRIVDIDDGMDSLQKAISSLQSDDIVVYLPKESHLAHHNVLAELSQLYTNSDTWLTYGPNIEYPLYQVGYETEIPADIIAENSFRTSQKTSPNLQTFYAGLFQKIKRGDLISMDAIIFPMLEMAGSHIQFLSSMLVTKKLPLRDVDPLIFARAKYRPLASLNKTTSPKKVYITTGYWGHIFDNANPCCTEETCGNIWCRIRSASEKEGFTLLQADSLENLTDFDYLIVLEIIEGQLPHLMKYPQEKLILMLWEPPSVLPANYNMENHRFFSKVYTWKDDLIDNQKYFKFYYPSLTPQIPNPIPFDFKRLCTLISCNKRSYHPDELYSERVKVIEFFENFHSGDFELYGRWWPAQYKTYQGEIGSKTDYLKYYKFSFAYENIRNVPGYITEKIFDCFKAGVVPIYLGASNITQYIPQNCFINRNDFANEQELYNYLTQMSESKYLEYMKNIQLYLNSDQAKLYSIENFVNIFMEILQ